MRLVAVAIAVLCLDQWSKRAVRVSGRGRRMSLGPLLRIRVVSTSRPGFARHDARVRLVLLWVAALICTAALYIWGAGFQSLAAQAGVGAALGGAAGNLLDILRRRAVTDFIDLGWWPVFNIADIGIVCGLLVAFWPRG
jgi:signal peptidase II